MGLTGMSDQIYKLEQTNEQPVRIDDITTGSVRYLYVRSAESQDSDTSGQDYLTWFNKDTVLAYVICDGVSGSFFGEIAAKFLGDKLLLSLIELETSELGAITEEYLIEYYKKQLKEWQLEGQKQVDEFQIPNHLPDLQRNALQKLREEHGSETVFTAGLVDQLNNRLILIWMGDAEVRLFNTDNQLIQFNPILRNSDRWSTKYGANKRGATLHVRTISLEENDIARIIAFSDGLSSVSAQLNNELEDHKLEELVAEQLKSPTSDDISYFELRFKYDWPIALHEGEEKRLGKDEHFESGIFTDYSTPLESMQEDPHRVIDDVVDDIEASVS